MPDDFHIAQATEQLDRVLGFFDRADSKASLLFAVDSGLLALIALNLQVGDFGIWYLVLSGVLATLAISISLFFLYKCAAPNLSGGSGSLIYFSEIAKRTEAKFIADFLAQSKTDFAQDVLGQVWRNSEILRIKFNAVRYAFAFTAGALIPWCVFIGTTSIIHAHINLS